MFKGRGIIKISGSYFESNDDELESSLKIIIDQKFHEKIIFMVGGGNIVRGRSTTKGMQRTYMDRIGMLSTEINALRLSNLLYNLRNSSIIMSSHGSSDFVRKYNVPILERYNKDGYSIILSGGLGCGYISTDTALVIRALELECQWVAKICKVGGVFESDPRYDGSAKMIEELTYQKALQYDAYDKNAILYAQEHNLPFSIISLNAFVNKMLDKNVQFTQIF